MQGSLEKRTRHSFGRLEVYHPSIFTLNLLCYVLGKLGQSVAKSSAAKNGFTLASCTCDHALIYFLVNLNTMRHLVTQKNEGLSLEEFDDTEKPRYALLSHTWGADGEEVTFKYLLKAAGKDEAGYRRIMLCGN